MMAGSISRKNNSCCQKEKCSGFTLYEFCIVGIIVAILLAVLAQRVVYYQQEADAAAAQRLVGILRAALQMRTAGAVIAHREQDLLNIREENPIDWLVEKPKNYLGEYYHPATSTLPKGYWYFDRSDKTLVYLLNNEKSFEGGRSNLLKFKVKFPGVPSDTALPSGTRFDARSIVLDQVADADAVR